MATVLHRAYLEYLDRCDQFPTAATVRYRGDRVPKDLTPVQHCARYPTLYPFGYTPPTLSYREVVDHLRAVERRCNQALDLMQRERKRTPVFPPVSQEDEDW